MSSDPLATYAGRRGSAQWFLNRLRCMSPAEVMHRAGAVVEQRLHRLAAQRRITAPGATPLRSPVTWLAAVQTGVEVDAAPYERAADRVLAGEVVLLDDVAWQVGCPPRWYAAPVAPQEGHGPDAPSTVYTGDERLLIELHRHQALVTLAQAWRAAGEPRYRDAAFAWLVHWLRYGAHAQSPAWNSALEPALRLVNWAVAWQLLDADRHAPAPLRQAWLAAVFAHARFVRLHRSHHSSANNHLVGELAGLYLASLTWPLWPQLIEWGDDARGELATQALAQNAPDGVNREQSTRYQVFVFELLALAAHAARAAGTPMPAQVHERLAAMLRFVAGLRDAGGHVPAFGDADGARAIRLDPEAGDPFDAAIAWGVAAGFAPDLAPCVRASHRDAAWIFGATAAPAPAARRSAADALARAYADGGYFILGSRSGDAREVLMHLDAGPLGYLAIAAHGHADALSLCLSLGGEPVLVDRGTFVYNSAPVWRRFLRGTLAHNTVCVDGLDQSTAGGPFLWVTKARTELIRFTSGSESGAFGGRHDGYRRLGDPVEHARQVEWSAAAHCFHVVDTLDCKSVHDIAIAWHFAPGCKVVVAPTGTVQVSTRRATLDLRVQGRHAASDAALAGRWSLHHGAPDEHLGWHSARFGERVPAPTLVWRARIDGACVFVTTLDYTLQEAP